MYCKYECRGDRGRLLVKLQKRLFVCCSSDYFAWASWKRATHRPSTLGCHALEANLFNNSNVALWTADVYNLLKWILLINRWLLKGCGKHFPDYTDKEQHCLMAFGDGNKWRHLVVWRSHCYRQKKNYATLNSLSLLGCLHITSQCSEQLIV